ncbi:hypothetical protein [Geodermatophilus sp. DSM 44513]|uniref:hypothetical protein n=1 Tax=Geodermatophilus sp. DSM 44513 TaxID=1528104 RepID=UPI001412415D|nr:hypothetical protein [Geodermatophilus sp. DSM 44513]WNV73719.1 hypothetical protein RTG05_12065 [Geodermatophilus sp. DSM 44513]
MTMQRGAEQRPDELFLVLAALFTVVAAVGLGLAAWDGGSLPLSVGISSGFFAVLFWAHHRDRSGAGSVRRLLIALGLGVVALVVLVLGQQWWYAACVGLAVGVNAVRLGRPSGSDGGSRGV